MDAEKGRAEGGFSLVELLVAMVVTLIVSGAIYGLIASGQSAFRREPELADRQQNIRVAMALIEQDVANAGAGVPLFSQVFTANDGAAVCQADEVTDCLNGSGIPGALGADAADARNDDPSDDTDVLEMVGADDRCPSQTVCSNAAAAGDAGDFQTREPLPACLPLPGLVLLADAISFRVQPAAAGDPAPCATDGTGVAGDQARNGSVELLAALAPWQVGAMQAVAVEPNRPSTFLYAATVARYMIAPSGEVLEGHGPIPALWRSATGAFETDGTIADLPGDAGFTPAGSPWQLVARGIEDLQVEYLYVDAGGETWTHAPRGPILNDFTTVVRQVRVTLSARAIAPNLQGATIAGGAAPDAVRGQLTRVIAPRASLVGLDVRLQLR